MPVSHTPPPRGWYPDPTENSRERYWDGAAWTQVVRRAEIVIPIRQTAPTFSAPPPASANQPTVLPTDRPSQRDPAVRDPALALPLASWGRRFGSGVGDILAAWILTLGLLAVFSPDFLPHLWDVYLANVGEVLRTGVVTVSAGLQSGLATLTMVLSGVTLVYTVVFLGAWGATPGQRAFRIRVVKAPLPPTLLTAQSAANFVPEKPGWLRSMLKGLGWTLFSTGGTIFVVAQLVNTLLPLWHKRKQSLTDLLASTLVIRAEEAESQKLGAA